MNKRQNHLAWMRIAGYHDDRKAFTILLIESRINRPEADAAFYRGQQQRASGMGCACPVCKRAPCIERQAGDQHPPPSQSSG